MIINDKIYGRFEITEPVLIELINSAPVERLKKISQHGLPVNFDPDCIFFSRYEHCLGAMLMLRYFNASLGDQIAGLLHDVSHLAFSHTADWVFHEAASGREDYHEIIKEKFIAKSDIPTILNKYGFDPEKVTCEENYTLLEMPAPDLCTDRIDYTLREFEFYYSPESTKKFLDKLIVKNDEFLFKDYKSALDFAEEYLDAQLNIWASNRKVRRVYLFSEALKIALKKGIIREDDFFKNDNFIFEKINKANNPETNKIFEILNKKELKYQSFGKTVHKKFRYIDPKILQNGKIVRLTEIDSKFKEKLEREKKKSKEGIIV